MFCSLSQTRLGPPQFRRRDSCSTSTASTNHRSCTVPAVNCHPLQIGHLQVQWSRLLLSRAPSFFGLRQIDRSHVSWLRFEERREGHGAQTPIKKCQVSLSRSSSLSSCSSVCLANDFFMTSLGCDNSICSSGTLHHESFHALTALTSMCP